MSIKRRRINMKNGMVITPTKQEFAELSTARKGTIKECDLVSVRKEPSEASKPIGYVQMHEKVAILEDVRGHPDQEQEYCKIRFGKHQIGYVSSDYVRR